MDEFAGDEREIVSVLNVFKTSVDTINASSITSDMTIGANLNGGSLTIGAAGATTSINSNITNIGTGGLTGSGRVNIGSANTNSAGSQVRVGNPSLSQLYLQGFEVNINDQTGSIASPTYINMGNSTSGITSIHGSVNIGIDGLPATGKVNIGTGNNSTGSEMFIGSETLGTTSIRGKQLNINTVGTSTTTIGNSNANIILNGPATVNGTITPGYSYPIYSTPNNIPNQIGARGIFGGGGNQLYVIGDGNWRSYASYNNVPLGIYSVQVWMTAGSSTYLPWTVSTPLETALYIRTDPFYVLPSTATTTPNNIVEQPTIIQYLYNPLHNFKELATGALHVGDGPLVNQVVATIIVYVDKPSVALCLRATISSTPNTSFAYTEMVLTRIA